MSIPGSASPLFFQTASGAGAAFTLQKSVRFNDDDSAYLNRTPSSASNRKTFTYSTWVKRSELSDANSYALLGVGAGTYNIFGFKSNGAIRFEGNSPSMDVQTSALHRDASAWYHIILAVDTTQSTAADRIKMYVNGVQQTDFSNSQYPSQDSNTLVNNNEEHKIGRWHTSRHFDGYMAQTVLIDGLQLDESSFGEFDNNGVWQAKDVSGLTFGTNGFHLFDFASESGIGNDASGNDNDFSVNNLTASVPTVASFSSPSWSNPGSYWNLSDQDSNSAYQTATYSQSSQYSNVTSSTLANNTTYHFFLEQFAGSSDSYGGWFFVDGSSAPSNTVPDELGGDTLGLRVGETSAGTYGSYATANGTSQTQNQIDLTSIKANASGGAVTFTEFVINTTVDKVWVRAAGASSWIGGGNPATSSSTPSFHISGASNMRFGYVAYSSGTYAKYKSAAGSPTDVDLLFDVPTNGDSSNDTGAGGEVSANYCTLNPLDKATIAVLHQGNLSTDSSSTGAVRGTFKYPKTGKWYYEVEVDGNVSSVGYFHVGIATAAANLNTNPGYDQTNEFTYWQNGSKTGNVSYATTFTDGDIIGVAFDAGAGSLTFYKNGSSQGVAYTGLTGEYFPYAPVGSYDGHYNFGQRAFAYSVSNYLPLSTTNLPTPTIADGSTAMSATLWTGNGSTQTISGLNHSPDFIWHKIRSIAGGHQLYDSVRGASKRLRSDTDDAESTVNGVTAFNSDGWTMTGGNNNNETYVSWTWDAGTSTVSNTDGDITSQVRASQTAGFSIVKYSGTGNSGDTVGHGLNTKPESIWIKGLKDGDDWQIYHSGLGGPQYQMFLNVDGSRETRSAVLDSTEPTSSVFTLGNYDDSNDSSTDYLALCFAPVEGYSAFGVYTGDGTAKKFVYLGFRPAFVLIKRTDGGAWVLIDSARSPSNEFTNWLRPNESEAESTNNNFDIVSNGFVLRKNDAFTNTSNKDHIYFAFAENPFQANGGLAR